MTTEELYQRVVRQTRREISGFPLWSMLLLYLCSIGVLLVLVVMVYPKMQRDAIALGVPLITPQGEHVRPIEETSEPSESLELYKQFATDPTIQEEELPELKETQPNRHQSTVDQDSVEQTDLASLPEKTQETAQESAPESAQESAQESTQESTQESAQKPFQEQTRRTPAKEEDTIEAILQRSEPPLPVAQDGGDWSLQLGAYTSKATAEEAWKNLSQGDLHTFHPAFVSIRIGQETYVRLQAGFLNNREEGQIWCSLLKEQGQDCLVIKTNP